MKYDNLASFTTKVEVVRMVMEENVRIALKNTEKVDDIHKASSE
jgi:hypothetical protein